MSRKVKIGGIYVGGGEKVAVQSMCDVKTEYTDRVIAEINELESLGCDIIRVAVKDEKDALSIPEIKKNIRIPLVADIHFDYKLAIKSIENGVDKIRINPGNIGGDDKVEAVAKALKESGIAVRVGSNTGSVEKKFLEKYGKNEISLAESALEKVAILEKFGVENIVISAKASSAPLMVKTYRYLAKKTDYPLHLGVTEAGSRESGIVKNSVGIGSLLLDGIGDTIRVSLTAPLREEVLAAKRILRSVGLEKDYVEVVSCPTCGRTGYDLFSMLDAVEREVAGIKKPLKIAVMGCVVNGPGEAKDCDLGIAGGEGKCVIFKKGEVFETVEMSKAKDAFIKEIRRVLNEKRFS